jgi:hypothetical protein
MKRWHFKVPCKGEVEAVIDAETEEQAREILKTDDWEMQDDYCFDPDVTRATLTGSSLRKLKRTKIMKIRIGYSMGYSGTDTEWTEEIPADVVEGGEEEIAAYISDTQDELYAEACEKISVWAKIEE